METGPGPSRRPIWEIEVLRDRPTFVAAALGGDGAARAFARNERGRDFVVGDIHGMFSALENFLEELSFDPGRDRLFSVGDLIDRGPESDPVLQWLTGAQLVPRHSRQPRSVPSRRGRGPRGGTGRGA